MTTTATSPNDGGSLAPLLWIEIDEAALAANVGAAIAALTPENGAPPKIMAVVKANGYGHGIAAAARAFVAGGADALAVTTIDEAAEIVPLGFPDSVPLLVFAPVIDSTQATWAVANNVTVTVCDVAGAEIVANAASRLGKRAHVHLKVDTGMGRFGLPTETAIKVAEAIARADELQFDGIYTHFARSLETDLAPTRAAARSFTHFCDKLGAHGIACPLRHCAASAAAFRLPDSRLEMVRLGTVLYGQYPAATVPRIDGLNTKTWSAKARVVFVHDVEPGSTVGYGAQFKAKTRRRVAVLPVGFADGFATSPNSRFDGMGGLKVAVAGLLGQSRASVYFDGQQAPVVGRVAMQTIVVDVTDLSREIRPGDVAEIPMRRLAARSSIPRIPTGRPDAKKMPAPEGAGLNRYTD